MVNIELKSNTAYGNVVFQSSETVDHTYEPLENYENIGGHSEEVSDVTSDHPTGSDNMTEQVNDDTSDQPPVSHDETHSMSI